MPTFSTGDAIALAVGSIAGLRWLYERYVAKSNSDGGRFQIFREEFVAFKAGNEAQLANVREALERLDTSTSSLQNQIRHMMLGASGRLYEFKTGTDDAMDR